MCMCLCVPVYVCELLLAVLYTDTNGDNELDESELEALFQKEVSVYL